MPTSYTVTLNDNVVAKLQEIVGAGGGNSLISTTDFLTAIHQGSTIDVDKLVSYIQTNIEGYDSLYGFMIPGIIHSSASTGSVTILDSNVKDYDSSSDALSIITGCKTNIEATQFGGTLNNGFVTLGIDYDNYGENVVNYGVLMAIAETYDGCTSQFEYYPLTIDDILSFMNIAE